MTKMTPETPLEELAALISQALQKAGIAATLSGGAAVSVYSDNEYPSHDLDFVSSARLKAIEEAIGPLGFHRVGRGRHFEHPDTPWYVEFHPGPLAFGEARVPADENAGVVETEYGPLRIVTPTQIIMDRVAAHVHWHDNQSLDQAIMVAARQPVDWAALYEWAEGDRIDPAVIDEIRGRSAR